MRAIFQKYWRNKEGVTAVETALVLPFVCVFMFGILQIALVYYDLSMTINSMETASRKILILSDPTDQDVYDAANAEIHSPRNGTVALTTTIVTKYGSDYAQLSATYNYMVEIPMYPQNIDFGIDRTINSEIVLQR